MNTFLDESYEVPSESNNYMKFGDGENKIRILPTTPIIGWEYWVDTEEGKRKPVRSPMNSKPNIKELKHFWAMVVWNYKEERIQILEVTQSTIQKAIKAFSKDTDWGKPFDYDIVITKTGEKLQTEYQITPKPHKAIDPKIKKLYEETPINLNALFTDDDPFQFDQDGLQVENETP